MHLRRITSGIFEPSVNVLFTLGLRVDTHGTGGFVVLHFEPVFIVALFSQLMKHRLIRAPYHRATASQVQEDVCAQGRTCARR